jgi:capsular polysaccharide biosynthesis protein
MLAERGIPRVLGELAARRWWLLPAAVVVAVAVAAGVTSAQKPLFEATSSLVVTPGSELREPSDVLRSLETLERRTVVATLAKLPTTPETRQAAADRLGLAPADLADYRVGAAVQPYTNIIAVTVLGPDPQRAADLANAVSEVSRHSARPFARIFTLKTLAAAQPAREPVSPDPVRNLLVAAVLGIAIGAAVVWRAGAARPRA